MLRFLVRFAGLLALAAAFAALVVDGTRSIAASALSLTPVSLLLGGRVPAQRQALVGKLHPLLWDPVTTTFLRLPLWLVLGAAGLFLMWIARRREPGVGYSTR